MGSRVAEQAHNEQLQQRSGRREGRTQHDRTREPASPSRAARASATNGICHRETSVLSSLRMARLLVLVILVMEMKRKKLKITHPLAVQKPKLAPPVAPSYDRWRQYA